MVSPNTNVYILKDCPLESHYEHTIFFNSLDEQYNYFIGLSKYNIKRNTYQRVNRNTIRVEITTDNLYDCNYMMFQNTNYGNKWFYAFIDSVNYINDVVTEITYTVDVMQTWFFDYNLEPVFVEREHSATDVIGEHTIPENLETGEFMYSTLEKSGIMDDMSIVLAATFDENYDDVAGGLYNGIYSGLYYHSFPLNLSGAEACNDFIEGAGAKMGGIISIFLMPTEFVQERNTLSRGIEITEAKNYDYIKRTNGFAPKNNKLLTYPYNFLEATNFNGMSLPYRYEFWRGSSCDFMCVCNMDCSPTAILMPKGYKENYNLYLADEKLTLTFPQLTYNTDPYKEYLGLKGVTTAVNTALSAGAGAGAIAGGVTLAGTSMGTAMVGAIALPILHNITSLISGLIEHRLMPDQAHVSAGDTSLASVGLLDFGFYNRYIRPEYVDIIDDYFTMFGYATRKIKIPNRAVRPHWTYTKTIGCHINGSIPQNDVRKICNIYDQGITFWRNGNELGNYNLDNRVGG